ncbi:MAG: GFA family protein [Gammaproteobacteria bacterium]
MSDSPFASGHCLCGAVSYTIKSEPVRMAQCHCVDCQRASGGGHMSLAFFKEEDMEISGELKSFAVTGDIGALNTRYFCPECGSRLFGSNSAVPGVRAVTAGTMDDSSWFKPGVVIYTDRQPAWDCRNPDIPNFPEGPPPPPPK